MKLSMTNKEVLPTLGRIHDTQQRLQSIRLPRTTLLADEDSLSIDLNLLNERTKYLCSDIYRYLL